MMDLMFDETVLLLQKENAHLLDENFRLSRALLKIISDHKNGIWSITAAEEVMEEYGKF